MVAGSHVAICAGFPPGGGPDMLSSLRNNHMTILHSYTILYLRYRGGRTRFPNYVDVM